MKLDFLKPLRIAYYYFLSTTFTITALVSLFSIKGGGCLAWYFTYKGLKPYLKDWALIPALLAYAAGMTLIWMLIQLIIPEETVENLEAYGRKVKDPSYIERYGSDYPKPKIADFGISEDEWRQFESRFRFNKTCNIAIPLAMIGFGYLAYFFSKSNPLITFFLIILEMLLMNSFEVIPNFLNRIVEKRHPMYWKMKSYQDACKIYSKVRREIYTY